MNKEELQQRIENMKFELRELEELLEEDQEPKKEEPKTFPQEGDEYCYDAMDLNDDEDHDDYYDLEKAMVINENYFKEAKKKQKE